MDSIKIGDEEFAMAIFEAQNKFRQNPHLLQAKMEGILPLFSGKVIHFPDNPVGLRLVEGSNSYKDAIKFLKVQEPLPALKWSSEIAKASRDHAKDLSSKGIKGHAGSDGSTPASRIQRYCSWLGSVAENISYGKKDPEMIIVQLVADDNVPGRGHRKNIFNPSFCLGGVATATHASHNMCCVMNYASAIGEKGKKEEIKVGGMDLKGSIDQTIEDFKNGNDPHRPPDTVSSKIRVQTQVRGTEAVKTVTKTYTLKDGSTKEVKLTESIK